jgi:hypothetical protein
MKTIAPTSITEGNGMSWDAIAEATFSKFGILLPMALKANMAMMQVRPIKDKIPFTMVLIL